jgi:NhaA family Na+:H+ antiporter
MDRYQKHNSRLGGLPREPIDHVARPLARFLRIETASGAILLLAVAVALALANTAWAHGVTRLWETPIGVHAGPFAFQRPLRDWINDGLMTLFFFVVALELKREFILGELSQPRIATLSIAAATGGMLVPAGIYLALQSGLPGAHGWGTVMATDTAFVIGCLALLGPRTPQGLRVFLLSLAVVDDIGAILVVAIGYSHAINWVALALGAVGFAVVRGMALLGIRDLRLYILAGIMVWLAIDASGIHATVTGVVLGLMTPTRGWVSDRRLRSILERVLAHPPGNHWSGGTDERNALRAAETAARETLSPVEQLEATLHPWVAFGIMPLFALANAGVPFSLSAAGDPIALAVAVGFVLGKPIGVVGFAWLAVRSGLAERPAELGWGTLAGGGLVAGIGFTMALFIADLAFQGTLLQAAKLGILVGSLVSAAGGLSLLAWLGRGRPRHPGAADGGVA